jgi:hypothetical protein
VVLERSSLHFPFAAGKEFPVPAQSLLFLRRQQPDCSLNEAPGTPRLLGASRKRSIHSRSTFSFSCLSSLFSLSIQKCLSGRVSVISLGSVRVLFVFVIGGLLLAVNDDDRHRSFVAAPFGHCYRVTFQPIDTRKDALSELCTHNGIATITVVSFIMRTSFAH